MACAHKQLIYIPHEDNTDVLLEVCRKCKEILDVVQADDEGYELEGDPDEYD